ncbi:monosaccharide transporter [Teratosphaeria nubilosa]|uniref:Monosaccharide transporter n=1 Tax=Teratosphaeria nubilosa TaxID=161662 RepID=A0A6G1LL78_9PEZI|nr:monosaccharide transporter [Teratosphaeria nubilosa]
MASTMPVSRMEFESIEAPTTFKAYLMCAFAAFAGMLFGYDSGYISSVLGMPYFLQVYGSPNTNPHPGPEELAYQLSSSQHSLVVSILSAGTFFGALFSGVLADRIGRKVTIIAGCGVFFAGVIIQVAAISIAALSVGRLVAGVGVGFVSAVTILYMSEVAPRNVRGAIVSCYQFAITIGLMLASIVTYCTEENPDTSAFRIPISVQFLWAIVLVLGLLFLPESPRYFVKKGRLDLAMTALARVRGQAHDSEYVLHELAEIQANYEYEQQLGEVTWLGCFSGSFRKSNSNARKVFLGIALQMFQQFTGINFIFYYNTTFFQRIGLGDNPFLISLITTIVNMASTPISFYTIEKFGRRPLLIYGALSMMVCELIIAAVGTATPDSKEAHLVLITFVCLYIFFFASTWGPAAWVVVGEIFQLPIRSKGVALSTASNWFWNCIIAICIPYMIDKPGYLGYKVFFIWGGTCGTCALFAYMFVHETKGLTLEQVDRMMEDTTARRSPGWRARMEWQQSLNQYAREARTQQYTRESSPVELSVKTKSDYWNPSGPASPS